MKVAYLFALLTVIALNAQSQVSVVPSTGIAPQFPKADTELSKQVKPPSRNWLRDANDDSERFRRIELWAAAGDQEMHEIAARMRELHAAIQRAGWDMAIFQLEKIKGRLIVAGIKRPTRTKNMEALFFDSGAYQGLHEALTEKNAEAARGAFSRLRAACMACHAAERISFINESAVFREIEAFPLSAPK